MNTFWLCFIPLFVAVDPIGILPMFISLTEGLPCVKKKYVILQSAITAMVVAGLFITLGKTILEFLGVRVADFMIAGGILLFIISLSDLLSVQKKQRLIDIETLGAVPLGVPLIVGPAVLTTAVVLVTEHGTALTIITTFVNILIAAGAFWLSDPINKLLGNAGVKTISKIASLFLAAIAIMLVRKGITTYITGIF